MANVILCRAINQCVRRPQYAVAFSSRVRRETNKDQDSLLGHRKLKSVTDSLADRGFLRSYKPYNPPDNVADTIAKLSSTLELSSSSTLSDLNIKFELLKSCSAAFQHQVPNSVLHELRTVQDVVNFYSTPVDSTLPMDRIQNMPDIPQNLYIQQDYVRYSPEDPMFERSAFPKSSTLVSGIKTRRKYKGHEAKRSWY